MLTPRLIVATIVALALAAGVASAQENVPGNAPGKTPAPPVKTKRAPVELPHINFKSLDGETNLIAHIFRPPDPSPADAPRAAVVMLHGCSGLLGQDGRFFSSYRAWTSEFLKAGYVVLVVDSAKSRGKGQTCTGGTLDMLRNRPKDAYAALQYLQTQSFVAPDRIALVGWSQGGGVVLLTVNDKSHARPADLKHDFRAAVAFYPGVCDDTSQSRPYTRVEPRGWTTTVPLLVLHGEDDVWTRFAPCADFISSAKARGNPVELKAYPGAVHSFDAPNMKRRELTHYRTKDGRIPVSGTDKDGRADALVRVPAFLGEKLNK